MIEQSGEGEFQSWARWIKQWPIRNIYVKDMFPQFYTLNAMFGLAADIR